MRQVGRIILRKLAFLSPIVAVTIAALWVQTYWVAYESEFDFRGEHCTLVILKGRVSINNYPQWWADFQQSLGQVNEWREKSGREHELRRLERALTDYEIGQLKWAMERTPIEPRMMPTRAKWSHGTRAAFPVAIALFTIPPILKLRRVRRRNQRLFAGQCVECGYDLRASGERCPECGSSVGAKRRIED
jgi:hypothetical protein